MIYPSGQRIEYYNNTTWVDISSYVVSEINGNNGMSGNKPTDRVAMLGYFSFTLNNASNIFTPYRGGNAPTLTGFNRGTKIRVSILINNVPVVFAFGRIDSISTDDTLWGNQHARINCMDWINVASNFPMKGAEIQINKTIDEAVTSMLTRVSIQPENTNFDTGVNVFPAVFSNVKDKTKAISEINKLALSELGYVYVLKDGTLRVESFETRSGNRTLDTAPLWYEDLDNLILNDGDDFLLNSGETLLLNEYSVPSLEFGSEKLDITLDDSDVINTVKMQGYPTRTATSLENVFSLGSPLAIAGGQTIRFTANYINPNGSNETINATNLQVPVMTTDYLMNLLENGTGTNVSANLTVTATYWGDVVDYEVTNNYTQLAYVTKLNARGYGIYYDSSIQSEILDDDSIEQYGESTITIDQRYQKDVYRGLAYARTVVEQNKIPKSSIRSAKFLANLNKEHMRACLYFDVGNLIKVYDARSEMSKYYYIFSRKFTITLGGIIVLVFGLMETSCIASGGMNPVAVEFSNTNSKAISYDNVPSIVNLPVRTFSSWVYLNSDIPVGENTNVIAGMYTDTGGAASYIALAPERRFRFAQGYSVARGMWQTGVGTISTGQWYHLVATLDASSDTNDPVLYINGVSTSFTEGLTPTGIQANETGVTFVVGNIKTPARDYIDGIDGIIKDVRIYNRILTPAEALQLYNAGAYAVSVTDGLMFQGITVSSELGTAVDLNGTPIPAGNKYFENTFSNVGTDIGSPLIRIP